MRIIIYSNHPYYKDDYLFKYELNRDELCLFSHLINLKDALQKSGGTLSATNTFSKAQIETVDAIIFIDPDIPLNLLNFNTKKIITIGIFTESKLIKKTYKNNAIYEDYDWLLTWDTDILLKYPKKSLLQMIPFTPNLNLIDNYEIDFRNFKISAISANKNLLINYKYNYYQERIKLYSELNKLAPNEFHLFGRGWEKPIYNANVFNALSKKLRLDNFINVNFNKDIVNNVYRSEVKDKLYVLEKSLFNICFENTGFQENYITEKIFQPITTGAIPIYMGASNISKYVPEDCYIDYKQFKCGQELFEFISKMDESEIEFYRLNGKNFASNIAASPFGSDQFINNIFHCLNRA